MNADIVEIQLDSKSNGKTYFHPIQRALRSRIDFMREPEPNSKKLLADFPDGIPGVIVGFNKQTNEGYVREPLHQVQYSSIRSVVSGRGQSLGVEIEHFPTAHRASWLFWMLTLVGNGLATMVDGEITESEFQGAPTICHIKLKQNPQLVLADQVKKQNVLAYLALPKEAQARYDATFGKPL